MYQHINQAHEAWLKAYRRQQVQGRNPKGWIRTYTGGRFWPLDPHLDEVDVRDIAHHLSNLCRYTGATIKGYSVAQHSVLVSRAVPQPFAKAGLLHDATEAYMNDLNRPVKRSRELTGYVEAEKNLWMCIAYRFGLSEELPEEVHEADDRMAVTEKRDLLNPVFRDDDDPHVQGVEPYDFIIRPLPQENAEEAFLARYEELFGEKVERFVARQGPPSW